MKVLIGNEPNDVIDACNCNDPDCVGWTYKSVPFCDIPDKTQIKHLLITPTLQTISELTVEINAKLCEIKLNEYGTNILSGHIARGIKDGYDMKSAIYESILSQITNTLKEKYTSDKVSLFKENDDNGKIWKKIKLSDRHSPSQYAFDILDSVSEYLVDVVLPESIKMTILPIKLFELEVQDKSYQKERFTAVVIELKCQILPTAIIVIKADESK